MTLHESTLRVVEVKTLARATPLRDPIAHHIHLDEGRVVVGTTDSLRLVAHMGQASAGEVTA